MPFTYCTVKRTEMSSCSKRGAQENAPEFCPRGVSEVAARGGIIRRKKNNINSIKRYFFFMYFGV